jgi:ribosome-binding factor A
VSQRTDRVDELLRQEIGAILEREVADPRIGFATVTDVETTPDLRHARVWVSVIGSEDERRATVVALQRAMGFVQRELGHRLRIKRIPALHVELDDSAERGTRVLRLLDELEAGHVPDDLPIGETLPTPVPRIGRAGDAPDDEPLDPAPAREPPSAAGSRGRPRRSSGGMSGRSTGGSSGRPVGAGSDGARRSRPSHPTGPRGKKGGHSPRSGKGGG